MLLGFREQRLLAVATGFIPEFEAMSLTLDLICSQHSSLIQAVMPNMPLLIQTPKVASG